MGEVGIGVCIYLVIVAKNRVLRNIRISVFIVKIPELYNLGIDSSSIRLVSSDCPDRVQEEEKE